MIWVELKSGLSCSNYTGRMFDEYCLVATDPEVVEPEVHEEVIEATQQQKFTVVPPLKPQHSIRAARQKKIAQMQSSRLNTSPACGRRADSSLSSRFGACTTPEPWNFVPTRPQPMITRLSPLVEPSPARYRLLPGLPTVASQAQRPQTAPEQIRRRSSPWGFAIRSFAETDDAADARQDASCDASRQLCCEGDALRTTEDPPAVLLVSIDTDDGREDEEEQEDCVRGERIQNCWPRRRRPGVGALRKVGKDAFRRETLQKGTVCRLASNVPTRSKTSDSIPSKQRNSPATFMQVSSQALTETIHRAFKGSSFGRPRYDIGGSPMGGRSVTTATAVASAVAQAAAAQQSTYVTDELMTGARELSGAERERMTAVFREMLAADGVARGVVQWSTVVKRLHGRLSPAHIQRLFIYFMMPKRFRLGTWMERMGLLLACNPEKRLRLCFSFLDVDGDGVLGHRDVFAALASVGEAQEHLRIASPRKALELGTKSYIATFVLPQSLGFDVALASFSQVEVTAVASGGVAEQRGVQKGDRVLSVNGYDLESMGPETVMSMVYDSLRPMSIQFCRGPCTGPSLFGFSDFEILLRLLQARDRLTTRLQVSILSARNLRNVDAGLKSDPYCVVDIPGKAHVRVQTKVVNDDLHPVWNEDKFIGDYLTGEPLRFTVRDRDVGKADEFLGRATLSADRFLSDPIGFDGELQLLNPSASSGSAPQNDGVGPAMLRVKVQVLGDGGIGFQDFMDLLGHCDFSFYSPMCVALTGVSTASTTSMAPMNSRSPGKPKLALTFLSALGFRSTDEAAKLDLQCICEIVGRIGTKRLLTKSVQGTDVVTWNERHQLVEFEFGDGLKFSIIGRDDRGTEELYGLCTLASTQLSSAAVSQAFGVGAHTSTATTVDLELPLLKGRWGCSPVLRMKAHLTGAWPS